MSQPTSCIEEPRATYFLRGYRIPLSGAQHRWLASDPPETIQTSFQSHKLVEIFRAFTYYLKYRAMLDDHFRQYREEEDRIAARTERQQEMFRRFAALLAQKHPYAPATERTSK
jgi:hypothetical protein